MEHVATPSTNVDALPQELLAEIFLYTTIFYPVAPPPGFLPKVAKPEDLGWINVTHVCRHWRTIAINYPCLWTECNLHLGKKWLDAFLKRSNHRLISFDNISEILTVRSRTPFASYAIVSKNLHRMRHLKFMAIDMINERLPRSYKWPVAAPHLISLLTIGYEVNPGEQSLFSIHMPALRHLKTTTAVPWQSSYLDNLITLDINADHTSYSASTNSQFFGALRRMRNLKVLKVGWHLPEVGPYHSESIIEFPNLEHLHLCGVVEGIAHVLRHIHIPPGVKITLESDEPEPSLAYLPWLQNYFLKERTEFTAISIRQQNHRLDGYQDIIATRPNTRSTWDPANPAYLRLHFMWETPSVSLVSIRDLYLTLPTAHVHNIHIEGAYDRIALVRIFAQSPEIDHITIGSSHAILSCMPILACPIPTGEDSILLPRLKSCTLLGTRPDMWQSSRNDEAEGQSAFNLLVQIVRARIAVGCPLEKINIQNDPMFPLPRFPDVVTDLLTVKPDFGESAHLPEPWSMGIRSFEYDAD